MLTLFHEKHKKELSNFNWWIIFFKLFFLLSIFGRKKEQFAWLEVRKIEVWYPFNVSGFFFAGFFFLRQFQGKIGSFGSLNMHSPFAADPEVADHLAPLFHHCNKAMQFLLNLIVTLLNSSDNFDSLWLLITSTIPGCKRPPTETYCAWGSLLSLPKNWSKHANRVNVKTGDASFRSHDHIVIHKLIKLRPNWDDYTVSSWYEYTRKSLLLRCDQRM